ncbi:MAG: ABC transporter permease [Agathobacter sp.]
MKKSILSMMCVVLAISTIAAAMYYLMMETTLFPKVEVGVVVPEENTMVEMITNYISSMDSVKSVCDFSYVSYEEGERLLSEGSLQVVIVLPANLYEDLNSWQSVEATILLPEEEVVGTRMFGQILSSGLGLLQVAEAGVQASYDVAKGENLQMPRREIGYFLGMKYVTQVLDRTDTFENFVISPTGKMTMLQFYFLGLFLCVCLIYGMNFSYLFEEKQRALQNKLCIEGVGKIPQALIRIMIMAIYLFVLELLVYGAGYVLSETLEMYFIAFSWSAVLGFMFLAVAISVHFHLIYAIGKDKAGAVILLTTSILMVLCGGLIVPAAYLPEPGRWLGEIAPLYSWSLLGQEILFGDIAFMAMGIPLAWMAIEFVMGVFVSWKNA